MKKIKKNRIQKVLILLFILTLILVPKAYAIDNKNLLLPDLTGKIDLGKGDFRLYGDNQNYFDYNIYTGIYTVNGVVNIGYNNQFYKDFYLKQFTYSFYYVSGTFTGDNFNFNYFNLLGDASSGIQDVSYSNKSVVRPNLKNIYFVFTDRTFENYKFKLQLEKGDIATSYEPPLVSLSLYQIVYNFYYDTLFGGSEIDVPVNILQILTVSTMFMIAFIPIFILGKLISKLWN